MDEKALDKDRAQELREVFALFDVDADGAISAPEIARILNNLKQKYDEKDIAKMIAKYDKDGNCEIDFSEFLLMMTKRIDDLGAESQEQELRRCFAVFDDDDSGSISPLEISRVLKAVGEDISDEEIKLMLEHIDTDGDGQIDFDEFKQMMEEGPPKA